MDWWVGWLVGWLVSGLVGWLVGGWVGWLAGWLAGWLVGWLADWLVGWLVGFLVSGFWFYDFCCLVFWFMVSFFGSGSGSVAATNNPSKTNGNIQTAFLLKSLQIPFAQTFSIEILPENFLLTSFPIEMSTETS